MPKIPLWATLLRSEDRIGWVERIKRPLFQRAFVEDLLRRVFIFVFRAGIDDLINQAKFEGFRRLHKAIAF